MISNEKLQHAKDKLIRILEEAEKSERIEVTRELWSDMKRQALKRSNKKQRCMNEPTEESNT
jgi:hypothetical protein